MEMGKIAAVTDWPVWETGNLPKPDDPGTLKVWSQFLYKDYNCLFCKQIDKTFFLKGSSDYQV